MIKIKYEKIYDFNKPTAIYCQIAISVLAEIYRTNYRYKGIKLKIKSVEAIIKNRVSYPYQLLSNKQIKGFNFTTEQGRFKIQLVDENGKHPYFYLISLMNRYIRSDIKVENFIVKEIEQVKSDVSFTETYFATLLNKTTPPKVSSGVIHANQITASSGNNLWQQLKIINLK